MGRELTSRFATESFRCISKCASQTTAHRARQGWPNGQGAGHAIGQTQFAFKFCHDHCPDLFLGIRSLQLNILATLVMANWCVSCQLDFIVEVRAVNL